MPETRSLGQLLEDAARRHKKKEALIFEGHAISYRELDEQAGKVANGLASLGLGRGERVAIMLPNTPEFVYSFFGIQKLGAVAVPFNTMYKGREITHILSDCGARAIITLTNFAPLINEIRADVPTLEHVIVTGQRTLVFAQPGSTAAVQMVVEKRRFASADEAFHAVGGLLVEVLQRLGASDAWYRHQGSIRAHGKKIATILISEIENLFVVNAVVFLDALKTDEFFKVVWVPPEIKDKALEPMTSLREESGREVTLEELRQVLAECLRERLGVELAEGALKRDELFGYQKNRALAYRT